MKIALFSDIHANLTALEAVLSHCFNKYGSDISIIHLGDCIDYGMRPNEVINRLSSLKNQILVNLKGNHEAALLEIDTDKFSSQRGYKANIYTKSIITQASYDFIHKMQDGFCEVDLDGKKILVVHGDLSNPRWGKMKEEEKKNPQYFQYNYVISGHTHISSLVCSIDKGNGNNTLFINPGSIGQPRNCNINAQYAVLDTTISAVYFEAVPYNYQFEQSLYNGEIDIYYKDRLSKGI